VRIFSKEEDAKLRKITNATRGTAAIEFAIVLPVLLAIVFGIIEFGAILYNQAVITNASREAARFSAAFYTNPANATATRPTCTDIQNFVIQYVHKYLINFASSTPFGTSNVFCCGTSNLSDPNCLTSTAAPSYNYYSVEPLAGYVDRVKIQYQYDFLVLGNLMGVLTGGAWAPSLTLTAQTAMRAEDQGP
jgi:Flp pilus assembly protein TadG